MPIRIQRKRSKGWTMPENTVYVGRPSKWGNPFIVDERAAVSNRRIALSSFEALLREQGSWSPIPLDRWPSGKIPTQWTTIEDIRRELRGKNLACWCRMGQACHADLLLEIANGNHELLGNMMASTAGSGDACPQGQLLYELTLKGTTQESVVITYAFAIAQLGDSADWPTINAAISARWKGKTALKRIKERAWKQIELWRNTAGSGDTLPNPETALE